MVNAQWSMFLKCHSIIISRTSTHFCPSTLSRLLGKSAVPGLFMRPVYHKSDGGIKAHLNLAVLAYWIVSVTKYRLKLKKYPNIRWEEIIRIAQTQVVVTAEARTEDGGSITVRQSTEAEEQLAAIYSLLDINPNPIGKIKSQVHPKSPQKNPTLEKQEVT